MRLRDLPLRERPGPASYELFELHRAILEGRHEDAKKWRLRARYALSRAADKKMSPRDRAAFERERYFMRSLGLEGLGNDPASYALAQLQQAYREGRVADMRYWQIQVDNARAKNYLNFVRARAASQRARGLGGMG